MFCQDGKIGATQISYVTSSRFERVFSKMTSGLIWAQNVMTGHIFCLSSMLSKDSTLSEFSFDPSPTKVIVSLYSMISMFTSFCNCNTVNGAPHRDLTANRDHCPSYEIAGTYKHS